MSIKPDYYRAKGQDVIDFCLQHGLSFVQGNIVKYIVRAGKKDPDKHLEDLYKAKEYLNREIAYVKSQASETQGQIADTSSYYIKGQ